jgi:hypothetical protein
MSRSKGGSIILREMEGSEAKMDFCEDGTGFRYRLEIS